MRSNTDDKEYALKKVRPLWPSFMIEKDVDIFWKNMITFKSEIYEDPNFYFTACFVKMFLELKFEIMIGSGLENERSTNLRLLWGVTIVLLPLHFIWMATRVVQKAFIQGL